MSKTVVVGLDGFHTDLLSHTPEIRAIYEAGYGTELTSTAPPITAPAWATFQTGTDVDTHGILDFVEYNKEFDIRVLNGTDLTDPTFYELLNDRGHSCYLQNLPFSIPPRIDGDVMPSWLDDDSVDPHPTGLLERYGVDRPQYPSFDPNDSKEAQIRQIKVCFEKNSRIFSSVLESGDHEFLFYLVSATDWLQHKSLDKLQSDSDTEIARLAKSVLADVDAFISDVDDSLEPDDDLILLSDHGFRVYERELSINDWLAAEGYLETSPDGIHFPSRTQQDETVVSFGSFVRRIAHLPGIFPVARQLNRMLRSTTDISLSTRPKIDIERSIAYAISKDCPAIVLADDADRQDAAEIATRACAVDGLDAKVLSPTGDDRERVLLVSDAVRFVRGPTGLDGMWNERPVPFHDSTGILVGKGSSFEDTPRDPHISDIAATLLLLFGHPVPDSMTGRPLTEWVGHGGAVETVTLSEYSPSFATGESKESFAVENRLQELGYL